VKSYLHPQRPLQLRLMGDWGGFNLTRICGWLAGELASRAAPGTRSTIHTGDGMGGNLRAVGIGEVDVAISTPAHFSLMAIEGRGPFTDEPIPTLRALGCVPHRDALMFAVRADLGIRTMADLREQRPPLRVALGPEDSSSFMGFGASALLRASGLSRARFSEWGGELLVHDRPNQCLDEVAAGNADATIQEAIMTRGWSELAETVGLSFLTLEPEAARQLAEDYSMRTRTVPADFLAGMDEPVSGIDFAGWLVVAREDMRDDVAALLASILVETSDVLERQYTHLPVRCSPLDYPVTAERLADVPIPLHPGAKSYYRAIGALPQID
jgi:TRAP transporter TAXI family solute receptor